MSSSDWEEVKRLAADFQRAQLSSTVQRLSERNCVEIVSKLLELKLLDLIFTKDGKEYLTHQEVSKEIKEELLVRGGRASIAELHDAIKVDFSFIEGKVHDLVRLERGLYLELGYLMNREYLDMVAEEINDELQKRGQVLLPNLISQYNLPADFIMEFITERLGTIIQGKIDDFDRQTIFTEAYVSRKKAIVRGAFSSVTRPISLAAIGKQYDIPEKLLYNILDELIKSKRLAGSFTGGKASYVPDIYSKSQNDWVDAFYSQNGYLEYDSLRRLDINDPKAFIKGHFKKEQLVYLSSCCVGKLIQEQLEATVEDTLTTGQWVDVMPILPSSFSSGDASLMLQKSLKGLSGVQQYNDTIVASDKFIAECKEPFTELMAKKAEKDAKTNAAMLATEKVNAKMTGIDDTTKEDKKESRRKKAMGGKAGGGTQGREVKTKSTKKKGRGRGDRDDDDEEDEQVQSGGRNKPLEFEFLSIEEIDEELTKRLEECPAEFITEIAEQLYRPLKREYQSVARSVFLQTAGSASSAARKKNQDLLQEKIVGLWTNVKLFEKGVNHFSEDEQGQLSRHLLKTLCTDITNLAFNALATEHLMSVSEETQITNEMRLKFLSKFPDPPKSALTKLHSSLSGKSIGEFCDQLETICGAGYLDILLKKPDKKKERQLIFNHRQALLEQLKNEDDSAMSLHLAVVVLFQTFTGSMVHAPGRSVPFLVTSLQQYMLQDAYDTLIKCQDLVVESIKSGSSEEGGDAEAQRIKAEMSQLLPMVKEIAITTKKAATKETNGD